MNNPAIAQQVRQLAAESRKSEALLAENLKLKKAIEAILIAADEIPTAGPAAYAVIAREALK